MPLYPSVASTIYCAASLALHVRVGGCRLLAHPTTIALMRGARVRAANLAAHGWLY